MWIDPNQLAAARVRGSELVEDALVALLQPLYKAAGLVWGETQDAAVKTIVRVLFTVL